MTQTMSGFLGISLGVAIIAGIQFACYKFIAWEDYHKAVVIAISCVLLGILATLFIIKATA